MCQSVPRPLIPFPCFCLLILQVIYFDYAANGVNYSSMWDGPGLPFAGSLIMISVDILLYLFLAYYLDNVIPSMAMYFHSDFLSSTLSFQFLLFWHTEYSYLLLYGGDKAFINVVLQFHMNEKTPPSGEIPFGWVEGGMIIVLGWEGATHWFIPRKSLRCS